MIRKLLLPALAAALLAGCATYGYRDGRGDYYYGQPSTQYRYYGGYGYPGDYGYPGYSGYGSSGYYGYGYGAPYWGGSIGYYRYYGPSRHWQHGGGHHDGNHDGGHDGGHDSGGRPPTGSRPDRPRAPWRDLGNVARPPVVERRSAPMPQVRRIAPQRATPVHTAPQGPRSGNRKRDPRLNPVD
jgi:hypothetical protein